MTYSGSGHASSFSGGGESRTRVRRIRPQVPTSVVNCRLSPAHYTVDEVVHGPAPASWVGLGASANRTLAWVTPIPRPTSARPRRAAHPQVSAGVSITQPTEGQRSWKRLHRQVSWHLIVCSVVNEARAPRLATRDQPSPSKPVHPHRRLHYTANL